MPTNYYWPHQIFYLPASLRITIHQIVSPIANSESTNFSMNISFSTGKLRRKKNTFWTIKKFVFFFNSTNWENFVKQIGENIWWIRYNSLTSLGNTLAPPVKISPPLCYRFPLISDTIIYRKDCERHKSNWNSLDFRLLKSRLGAVHKRRRIFFGLFWHPPPPYRTISYFEWPLPKKDVVILKILPPPLLFESFLFFIW